MTKKEMKVIRVVIMILIMFDFSQANYNPSSMQIGSNYGSDGRFACQIKCQKKCQKYLLLPPGVIFYIICYHSCFRKCDKMPIDVAQDCVTSCVLTKPIDINIGIHSLTTLISF